MIRVLINDRSFSYDVYSLVKAFYQQEDIEVEVTGQDENCPFSIVLNNEVIVVPYEGEKRKDYKNKIKRAIYASLSGSTGKSLPWGTLTGIRPTKLPMELLFDDSSNNVNNLTNNAAGNNINNLINNEIENRNISEKIFLNNNIDSDNLCDEENKETKEQVVRGYLKNTYLISDEKLDLSIEIAKRERRIIEKIDTENGYSLYIGIPFCPTTCMYCSFTSFPIHKWSGRVDEYLDALKKEIDYVSENFSDKKLDTIYIGGGTPTTLDEKQLAMLLSYINEKLDTKGVLEFSVEAGRPDSITEEKLAALKNGGVTRISVNPQTMNDETLKIIGRAHTVDDFYRAYEISKKFFDNINIDLILGLPGENEKRVFNTFEKIGELSPNSLTVHSMAVKRAAHMDEFLKSHPEIKTEITDEMMRGLHNFAAQLGLKPYYLYRQKNMTGNYENIGFSRAGYEGIYNISIMEEVQSIVALGAGSISKRVYREGRIERCDNVKDVSLYIAKIDEMIERKRVLFKNP